MYYSGHFSIVHVHQLSRWVCSHPVIAIPRLALYTPLLFPLKPNCTSRSVPTMLSFQETLQTRATFPIKTTASTANINEMIQNEKDGPKESFSPVGGALTLHTQWQGRLSTTFSTDPALLRLQYPTTKELKATSRWDESMTTLKTLRNLEIRRPIDNASGHCFFKTLQAESIYRYTYKNMCKAFSTLVENCQREYVFKNSKRHWTSMNFISNNWTCWFRQQTPTKQRWWMLFAILFWNQATICQKVWSTKVPKYRMTDPKVCHND